MKLQATRNGTTFHHSVSPDATSIQEGTVQFCFTLRQGKVPAGPEYIEATPERRVQSLFFYVPLAVYRYPSLSWCQDRFILCVKATTVTLSIPFQPEDSLLLLVCKREGDILFRRTLEIKRDVIISVVFRTMFDAID